MRLEFKRIIPMIVQNIMFVGEVFQIEVSDGLVHPLGSRQNVNLYPAVAITGARVFRSFYAFKVQRVASFFLPKFGPLFLSQRILNTEDDLYYFEKSLE